MPETSHEDGTPKPSGRPSRTSYSNFLTEQRALAHGEAVVRLAVDVLSISGPDARAFLQALLAQDLSKLAPEQSVESLLLDARGRIREALAVFRAGDDYLLAVDAPRGEALMQWFESMKFLLRVECRLVSSDYAAFGLIATEGGVLAAAARDSGAALVWQDAWSTGVVGGVRYRPESADLEPWAWMLMLVPVDAATAGGASLLATAPVVPLAAFDALRIAAGRPSFAHEVDDKSIPHELDWLSTAVSVSKGCFPGQETIAKVHNLGHPPRRLVKLSLDGTEGSLAAEGDIVRLDGSEVGAITSSAIHWQEGPIALAVVKRSTDVDAELEVETREGPVRAVQTVIVPVDAGGVAAETVRNVRRLL